MKAIVYDRYGTADELYLTDLPKPKPGRKEVLVRTKAISMNPRDVVFRKGGLKPLTGFKFPKLTGSDVSGIVEAVGPGVTRFKPGDPVFGYTQDLIRAVSAVIGFRRSEQIMELQTLTQRVIQCMSTHLYTSSYLQL